MKGLTPMQLVEITEFIQKHHNFGYVREADQYNDHLGYCIKYIDATYDSRQGDYWAISFRGLGKIFFSTNIHAPKEYETLYDWVIAFLKYEWEPIGIYDFMYDDKEGPLHNFPKDKMEAEWTSIDMIEAFCADLEDRSTKDTIDACKWITDYRNSKNRKV